MGEHLRFLLPWGREVKVDKNRTNQYDGRPDVGPTGPDLEEIMGKTLRVILHDLLLCLGTLSSSEDGRCRLQLNSPASLLDDPVFSERQLGSPSISSPLQLSNPFFSSRHATGSVLPFRRARPVPYRCGAGRSFWNQQIQSVSYSATPLLYLQRRLFQTPCSKWFGQLPLSTARSGFPFWFVTTDHLTTLHTAGEHH